MPAGAEIDFAVGKILSCFGEPEARVIGHRIGVPVDEIEPGAIIRRRLAEKRLRRIQSELDTGEPALQARRAYEILLELAREHAVRTVSVLLSSNLWWPPDADGRPLGPGCDTGVSGSR